MSSDAPSFQQESAQGKAAAQVSPSSKKAAAYHDMLEGLLLSASCSKNSHWHLNVLSNTAISAVRNSYHYCLADYVLSGVCHDVTMPDCLQ